MSVTKTTHETEICVSADEIYEFLADVEKWADIFPPTVHAQQESLEGNKETIRIWATVKGSVRTWTSNRVFDRQRGEIRFAQTKVAPPASAMTGIWKISALSPEKCRVSLIHHFDAATPEDLEYIRNAVDSNSTRELESIAAVFDPHHGRRVYHRTENTYTIDSAPEDAFDFLLQADLWPDRIPHVADSELTRYNEGGEYLKLTTRSPDGSTHETGSYRVELPTRRLVYKQDHTPGALISHRGEWQVEGIDGQSQVTSIHHFGVSEASIAKALGPSVSLEEAVELAAKSLIHNSATTIRTIDQWAKATGK